MNSSRFSKLTILLISRLGLLILFIFGLTTITIPASNVPAPMTGGNIDHQTSTISWLSTNPLDDFSTKLWTGNKSGPPVARIPLEPGDSATFRKFAKMVMNGDANEVRGVFVEELMALPVVQQPDDQATYVATQMNIVTQFQSAADHGVIGLLAHNFLSGSLFYQLVKGEEVRIVFGDGSYQSYQIDGSYAFQKLEPNNLQSDLVDMSTEEVMTTNQVFNRFYNGAHHVTFQTCLEEGGISNWGLTFIVADPLY
jgi:hypothetical protein